MTNYEWTVSFVETAQSTDHKDSDATERLKQVLEEKLNHYEEVIKFMRWTIKIIAGIGAIGIITILIIA